MKSDFATVNNITIESVMYYNNEPVLHYKIQYPQFIQLCHLRVLNRINRYYKTKALKLQRKYENQMYCEAVKLYKESTLNQFPFHMYESYVTYEVTYNQNCVISLYFDEYNYSGGAHGITVRRSDTWNLQSGCLMLLIQSFSCTINGIEYAIKMICKQIATQISHGEDWYFDDYIQLVAKNFNPRNFYLSPNGIVIYFQQYDIAPYSSGIPEFTIPWGKNVLQPTCCNFKEYC